ncbi:MAG: ROK family transcriptional regulator [Spirochaetes bacterium]|nr:ROK family transcriptional regulator [Spirochaetota bacterium]
MKAGKPKALRETNSRNILTILRNSGDLSIPELAARAHVSKTTVIKIIDMLQKSGLISAAGKGLSTVEGGKKPDLFKLNERHRLSLGIHIQSQGLRLACGDLKGNILYSAATGFRRDESTTGVVRKIVSTARGLLHDSDTVPERLLGIAVAFPGIVDFERGSIIYSPWFPSWKKNTDLRGLILKSLGFKIPCIIDNEFRFQVMAERVLGGHGGKSSIIVIGGGDGLGAGIMVSGTTIRGSHYLAGEIGHMVVNPGGDRCTCGGRGCFEAMVFRNRLLEMARSRYQDDPGSAIFIRSGPEDLAPQDVFDAAGAGDPTAESIMEDIIGWFAVALSNLIMAYDPEVIVIQGIYTGAGDGFLSRLRERLRVISLPGLEKDACIKFSSLGNNGAVTGAVSYLNEDFFRAFTG